jgi:hypothetical protein
MKNQETGEFEIIDIGNPNSHYDANAEETIIGPMFNKKELMEEPEDEHIEDYDEDYEDEEEVKTSAYYGNYSAGNFQAVATKNKLDDLGELLQNSKKFEHALEQTKLSHALYVDPEFHPNKKSLVGYSKEYNRIRDMDALIFKRSSDYFGPGVQVYDTMAPGDIIQGGLGDCYFLAAVSSIAEHPERLKRLFLSKRNHGNGIYAVAMCLNGVWEEIILDDFAPCVRSGKLAFNTSKTKELWVVLLEKAWAKVHGGYLNIEAGLTREALRDLTGASAKTYFLRQDPEGIWNRLMEGEHMNYIMTAGSDNLSGGSDAYIKKIGICGSHAYSLLAVYQLDNQYGRLKRTQQGEKYTHRLVKLRNPWGQGEWKGKWNDHDPNWTPYLKQELGFTGKVEDGIFFMEWEDFIKYYSDVQICYFHDGYKYSAEKYKSKRHETVFLKFRLNSPGKFYFSVNQRNRRFYSKDSGYRYTKIGWVLGRVNGNDIEFMGSGNKPDKENWDDPECEAGEYYVMINTPWRSITREFSFSVYGPCLTDLEKINEADLPEDFIRKVFKSKAKADMPKKGSDFSHRNHPGIKYVSGEKNGWAYMYFQNKEDSHQIKVTLKLGESKAGVKVMPPHEGHRPTMVVGPGEEDIIVYKSNGPKSISVSMMTSFKKVDKQIKPKPSGGGGGRVVRPDYNGGGGRVIRPDYNSGGGRVIRPDYNGGGGRVVRPDYNGGGGRVVRPDYNGGGGRVIRPDYNGGSGRVVRPDYNGGGGRVIRPDYSGGKDRIVRPYGGGGGRVIRPDYSGGKDRVVRPHGGGGGRIVRPHQSTDFGGRVPQPPSHDHDILSKARNSKITLSKKQNNQPVDIKVHFLYHPRGLALLYRNNTYDKTLNENIHFSLKNAHIEGNHGDSMQFSLGPGKEKLIQLVRNNDRTFEARIDKIMYEISGGSGHPVRRW